MTKSEIKAAIKEWEALRDELVEVAARYEELDRRLLDARGRICNGVVEQYGEGHIRMGDITYNVTKNHFHHVTVMDLDGLPDVHASDSRCVKSINPHFNPADLEGVGS